MSGENIRIFDVLPLSLLTWYIGLILDFSLNWFIDRGHDLFEFYWYLLLTINWTSLLREYILKFTKYRCKACFFFGMKSLIGKILDFERRN